MADFEELLKVKPEFRKNGRVYGWKLDDPRAKSEMLKAQADGYEFVGLQDEDGKKFAETKDARVGVDGRIRVGDAVLMSCSEEDYEKNQKMLAQKANPHLQVQAIKEEFRAAARAAGVRPLEDNE